MQVWLLVLWGRGIVGVPFLTTPSCHPSPPHSCQMSFSTRPGSSCILPQVSALVLREERGRKINVAIDLLKHWKGVCLTYAFAPFSKQRGIKSLFFYNRYISNWKSPHLLKHYTNLWDTSASCGVGIPQWLNILCTWRSLVSPIKVRKESCVNLLRAISQYRKY